MMIRVFAALLVLAALAMGAAMVVGGRVPMFGLPGIAPTPVASPADSFVVHDVPPAATSPTPAPDASAPAPVTSGLDAAIERLRAAKPDTTVTVTAPTTPVPTTPVPTTPVPTTPVLTTPGSTTPVPGAPQAAPSDSLLAGPNPSPSILAGPPPPPPPTWTAVTSQGVRWRTGRDALTIDMGGARTATVFVDPAFQALPQDAANSRVDFLKQTILESFPPGSAQFRFTRDGSVSLLR